VFKSRRTFTVDASNNGFVESFCEFCDTNESNVTVQIIHSHRGNANDNIAAATNSKVAFTQPKKRLLFASHNMITVNSIAFDALPSAVTNFRRLLCLWQHCNTTRANTKIDNT
jgi:hypothetical protein